MFRITPSARSVSQCSEAIARLQGTRTRRTIDDAQDMQRERMVNGARVKPALEIGENLRPPAGPRVVIGGQACLTTIMVAGFFMPRPVPSSPLRPSTEPNPRHARLSAPRSRRKCRFHETANRRSAAPWPYANGRKEAPVEFQVLVPCATQPNVKTQRRRATELQKQTERATRRPLK